MKLFITPKAGAELRSIADYTAQTWGDRQMERYIADLRQRMLWLANNPKLGRSRDDVRFGLRVFRQGHHLIFYRIKGDTVEIIGLPHASMDIAAYFDDEAGSETS